MYLIFLTNINFPQKNINTYSYRYVCIHIINIKLNEYKNRSYIHSIFLENYTIKTIMYAHLFITIMYTYLIRYIIYTDMFKNCPMYVITLLLI